VWISAAKIIKRWFQKGESTSISISIGAGDTHTIDQLLIGAGAS